MSEELTSYELSRDWFNFCFENPDLVTPLHTALYFFAIEHCNRLAWKKKFGLPTTMAKEAIGVKSWHTYIKAFNDLCDWGFFKLYERSKNQYSSNIIALSKNDKAHDKALDKAMTNHASKQQQSTHQSIDSINKLINLITNNQITIKPITISERKILIDFINSITLEEKQDLSWRNDFEIFKSELKDSFEELKKDNEWISTQEKFNPNVDIVLSIEKSIFNFWGTEAGWKNKKASKTKEIDWKSTFAKTLDKNKVYKQNNKNGNKTGNGPDFADEAWWASKGIKVD